MRTTLAAVLVFAGCGNGNDATIERVKPLRLPLNESIDKTKDCRDGGTVRIVATVTTDEAPDPLGLTLDADWTYTACVSKHYGTVDGTVVYSKSVAEETPDVFRTTLSYVGNLVYSGEHAGTCDATVETIDTSAEPNLKVSIAGTCPHPEVKKFAKLEKRCKLKSKKSRKSKKSKKRCQLKL